MYIGDASLNMFTPGKRKFELSSEISHTRTIDRKLVITHDVFIAGWRADGA